MGKLHSIKKAVLRNPKKFADAFPSIKWSCGVIKYKNNWVPTRLFVRSYSNFVKKCLILCGGSSNDSKG